VQTIVTISCNIVFLVVLKLGLTGYLLSIIIGYCIPIALMIIGGKLWKYLVPFRIDKKLFKEMLVYSIPMIPTILAWFINTSIDKYMIINMKGLGESGVYSVAHKIPTIITTILNIFLQAWQISAISSYGDSDQGQFYSKVYAGLNLVSITGFMFTMILTKTVAGFLFRKEFFEAWKYVPMLSLAAIFSSYSGFLAAAYRAAKKTKSLFVSVAAGAVVNVVLNYILLRTIGTIGASVATAISFFVVWLVRLIMVQKLVTIDVGVTKTIVSITAIIIAALLIIFDVPYSFIFIIALYFAVLFVSRDELKALIHFGMSFFKRKV
jgi:O-antigen/teichoic acid export membrane protein